MSINDGGPAFPATVDHLGDSIQVGPDTFQVPGMTLRDYFAGQALAGMAGATDRNGPHAGYAIDAYKFADAMIAERAKVQP